LIASCKDTVLYSLYVARLEQFVKEVKEEHSTFKIEEIHVPTMTEVVSANHIEEKHTEVPQPLPTKTGAQISEEKRDAKEKALVNFDAKTITVKETQEKINEFVALLKSSSDKKEYTETMAEYKKFIQKVISIHKTYAVKVIKELSFEHRAELVTNAVHPEPTKADEHKEEPKKFVPMTAAAVHEELKKLHMEKKELIAMTAEVVKK
jgi:uncharacterized membrane protein